MDEAHPSRMVVADTARSGARVKLDGRAAGGQCWWVIDTVTVEIWFSELAVFFSLSANNSD